MNKETKTLDETQALAKKFVEKMLKNKHKKATVIALYGELGSGKTSFVQGAARALGISQTVMSPTFVIERIYKIEHDHFTHFIHIDAYRLNDGDELRTLGWKEIRDDSHNIIFVEWAERVEEILPSDAIKIKFEYINENKRKITIV